MHIPGLSRPKPSPDTGPAYVERRPDESPEAFEARVAAVGRERQAVREEAMRDAYDDGRREQHRVESARRRRGAGLIGLVVVLVAALGALWLALAAREGSFAAGGAVVDQKLAEATQPAKVAIDEAADRTGAAVENAGQKLEAQGQRLREQAR